MDELAGIIRAEIRARGPMGCERFMELALYHPQLGYYRRKALRTGRGGDFLTSVSVGPLFGRLLGRQFFSMWESLNCPDCFRVIEQGAEDGQLACDILEWCRKEAPRFFEAVRYELIEESEGARRAQETKLVEFSGKVRWMSAGGAAEGKKLGGSGVFFSNELVDAFPVRRVVRQAGRWRELGVGCDEKGGLSWETMEVGEGALAAASAGLPEIEGYTTEIHLRARDWMAQAAGMLEQGYWVTVDYGFPASVYYAPFRTQGTLTAYREHRRSEEVLRDPGEQDITAHVDFTALARSGERVGLETLGFVDQQHFLMGIAEEELAGKQGPRVGIAENTRAWQMLTHPNHFGARFQVLVQGKDAPGEVLGLKFARRAGLD